MTNGWEESAVAWIKDMGERGDFSREFILDKVMISHVKKNNFETALDVGCGEGRFCRILSSLGVKAIGIDPAKTLIEEAQRRDRAGDYRIGVAENLKFEDNTFDLVVSYLSLIDIPDIQKGISEIVRVLKPGGTLLIATLTSFSTAAKHGGWSTDDSGEFHFPIDHYFQEREQWTEFRGIRVKNWHRPMSLYMKLLLSHGLILNDFDEPRPDGGDPKRVSLYTRVPWLMTMSWEKKKD